MTQSDLIPCNEPGNIKDLNIDLPPPYCEDDGEPSQKRVANRPDLSWLEEKTQKKTGVGQHALCDPLQTGDIINPPSLGDPNRTTVYRYSKALRGCDEAMLDLFRNITVIDEQGKAHAIPIIWATQEKAVAALLQENVRKDNSLVVDRIKLPMMSIYSSEFKFNQDRYVYHRAINYLRNLREDRKPGFTLDEPYERSTIFGVSRGLPLDIGYTLYVWTLYQEDMDQIVEGILLKFSPIAYIRVRGVPWEIGVKLNSIANNLNVEPGDRAIRVIKWQFTFTAETYIPQPLTRKKAVLKTRVTLTDFVEDDEVTQVLSRLETAVEELENVRG